MEMTLSAGTTVLAASVGPGSGDRRASHRDLTESHCQAPGGRLPHPTQAAQAKTPENICLRRYLVIGFSYSGSPGGFSESFQSAPDRAPQVSFPAHLTLLPQPQHSASQPSSASLPPQLLITTRSCLSLPLHYQGRVIYESMVGGTTSGLMYQPAPAGQPAHTPNTHHKNLLL